MWALLKQGFTDQYVPAKGGRNRMAAADWRQLGYMIRNQFSYRQGMAEEAMAGKLTDEEGWDGAACAIPRARRLLL